MSITPRSRHSSPMRATADRILKVGAAKSLEMAIVTVVRFFSVPLFLHAWTTEMYGEWLILYSLPACFYKCYTGKKKGLEDKPWKTRMTIAISWVE